MSTHQPSAEPARITVVGSEACHFCEDARRTLEQLAGSYPLTVETIDMRSETGRS